MPSHAEALKEKYVEALTELLRRNKKREVWEAYCGFLDLGVDDFMGIQRRLLEERLPAYARCELGRRVFKGAEPRTLEEFRELVPFTTYKDYAPFLLAKNEEALPERPHSWVHTSGTSSEYDFKWVPFSRRMYELAGDASISLFILSSARSRGEVRLRPGMSFPYIIAPPPYMTGIGVQRLMELIRLNSYPPIERALSMDFSDRLREAFSMALSEGMDFFFGITSILLKISEGFSGKGGDARITKIPLEPRALFRIAKAYLRAAAQGRAVQPRDIWRLKGAICGGMDTSIFKDRVAESWGIVPLEVYAATEYGAIAVQSWSRKGLTFYPSTNLWEFISEEDYHRVVADPSYIPRSCTMDEVRPDTEYVIAGTNFSGGALSRYILGDMVKFIALEDAEAGIKLPQMVFVSRIDGILDIGGFTRLTEKTIWESIEDSGVAYQEWTIRKEAREGKPALHLYIEVRGEAGAESVADRIHESLKRLNAPYKELEELTGLRPLFVSLLSKGTFRRYFEVRQAAGADLAHLKPPHVNAPDQVIADLLRMSGWKL
jgi:hypothetical protein